MLRFSGNLIIITTPKSASNHIYKQYSQQSLHNLTLLVLDFEEFEMQSTLALNVVQIVTIC
jgi:hypothetical protein